MASDLVGRSLDVSLVHRAVLRVPDTDPGRRGAAPVVVFEAGPGGGKTALLSALAESVAGRAPHSYLDLDQLRPSARHPLRALLVAVALQLARPCQPYGALSFPRFFLGILAIELDLSAGGETEHRSAVQSLLRRWRGQATIKEVVAGVITDAVSLIPGLAPAPQTIGALTGVVIDTVANRVRRDTAAHEWWARQHPAHGADPVAALIELNHSTQGEGRPNGALTAHATLLTALLDDLADGYRNGRYADERTANCVVLLDNADTAVGVQLLHDTFAAARPDGPGLHTDDPLVLVTTSRGGLLDRLPKPVRHATVTDVQPVAGGALPTLGRRRWARRTLDPLTEADIVPLVTSVAAGPDAVNLAQLLHQLGCGHPGATVLLRDYLRPAMRDHIRHGAIIEPEDLLTDDGGALEAALAASAGQEIDPDLRELLVTCSAARNRKAAEALLRAMEIPYPNRGAPFPVGWWAAADGLEVTMPRLLAQRELARRTTGPWNWLPVHRALALAEDDLGGRLHHLLAAEQTDAVATALTEQLPLLPAPQWLRLLDAATSAPHRPGRPLAVPYSAADEQDAEDGPTAFVRALARLEWTVRGPTFGSERTGLYRRLVGAYWRLLEHHQHDCPAVSDRIEHYQHLATRWRRAPTTDRRLEGGR
ncbi:hypothetical protein [Pilimelia columellifera]|uniref:AAA+ ATPase domain-containing protein n=1 Tax=Pilimelia columellifera subsp. columellifera TaxID=706583 RepID=A0ABN3NQE1_9ACTN